MKQRVLLMRRAEDIAYHLYFMRLVGCHLVSPQMELILIDQENICQVSCSREKMTCGNVFLPSTLELCILDLWFESTNLEIHFLTPLNEQLSCSALLVHPGKLDPAFKVTLVNATQWQYYGTPNTTGPLKMTWNSSLIRADEVKIELWGYREVSGSAGVERNKSNPLQAEWTYLYSLGRDQPNSGAFSFIPVPSEKPYSDWEQGSIRISASSEPDGARYSS